jgi:hypothetical protein
MMTMATSLLTNLPVTPNINPSILPCIFSPRSLLMPLTYFNKSLP